MNCPVCHELIEDYAVVCPSCGNRFAVKEQTRIIAEKKEKLSESICSAFRSPAFLINAILLTVISVICFANIFTSILSLGLLRVIDSIILFIAALISAINSWKCIGDKNFDNTDKIRKIGAYSSVKRVALEVMLILTSIVISIIVLLIFIGNSFTRDVYGYGSSEHKSSVMIGFVIILIMILYIVVFKLVFINLYKKISSYYKDTSTKLSSKSNAIIMVPPSTHLYIIGIILIGYAFIKIGISSIGNTLLSSAVDTVGNSLPSELSNIFGSAQKYLNESLASKILNNSAKLLTGAYLIVTALVFNKIYLTAQNAEKEISAEEAKLRKLNEKTREQEAEYKRLRDLQKEKEAQASSINQQNQKDLMEQFMNMMMMNNMNTNSQANNTQNTANKTQPPANETSQNESEHQNTAPKQE